VFKYKVDFIEDGGYEIDDIYFNIEYTIAEKPLSFKNEYRFDSWGLSDTETDFISFPYTIN